jgi:serine/threonine protein kinase
MELPTDPSKDNIIEEIKSRRNVLREYEAIKKDAISKLRRTILANERHQYETLNKCPLGKLNLSGINLKKLHTELANNFYNPEVMIATACVISSIILLDDTETAPRESIRYWFRKLSLLSYGSFGQTLLASLIDDADFVVKVPDDPDSSSSLFHEMMVGLLATNRLRKEVANFAYIYGGFACAHPLIGSDKKVLSYCYEDNIHIQYILYEKITDFDGQTSTPATEFLWTGGRLDVVNIILQLLFALNVAYEDYDFTHYDLHANNVLIRKLDKPISLRYKFNDNIYYINTGYIATIIDYGFAHFKLDNVDYGYTDAYKMDVFPDKSFPLYDIFKFITSVYKWSGRKPEKGHSEEVGEIAEELFKFFDETIRNEMTIEEILQDREIPRPIPLLPRISKYEKLTFMDFFEFIEKFEEFNQICTEEPIYEVFGCFGTKACPKTDDIVKQLQINAYDIPIDPYEFYDLLNYNESPDGDHAFALDLVENYNYKGGFAILKEKRKIIDTSLKYLIENTETFTLLDVDIRKQKDYDKYRERLDNIGMIIEDVTGYETLEKVYNFLVERAPRKRKYLHSPLINKVRNWLDKELELIEADILIAFKQKEAGSTIYSNIYDILKWY